MQISKKEATKYGFIPPENRKGKFKYGNIRTQVDGYNFDSKAEARHYKAMLKPLLDKGIISDLVIHPVYSLKVNNIKICNVEFDFRYVVTQTKEEVIIDVKGKDNPLSQHKRAHFQAQYGKEVNIVWVKKKRE